MHHLLERLGWHRLLHDLQAGLLIPLLCRQGFRHGLLTTPQDLKEREGEGMGGKEREREGEREKGRGRGRERATEGYSR